MKIFDDTTGMMIIPESGHGQTGKSAKVIAVTSCFCPSGHQLIDPRARFGGLPGIVLRVVTPDGSSLIALSPVFGDKSTFTFDTILVDGQEVTLSCPHCGVEMPVYGPCDCGSEYLAIFTAAGGDFADSIGICRRVGCPRAHLVRSGELVSQASIDLL